MVVKDQSVEIYQGNRRILTFTVLEEKGGSPQNLTTYSAQFNVALLSDQGIPLKTNPLIDLNSSGSQVVITDAVNGVVAVTLLEADTVALNPATYHFQFEVVDAVGNSVVVAEGSFTVLTNVDNA